MTTYLAALRGRLPLSKPLPTVGKPSERSRIEPTLTAAADTVLDATTEVDSTARWP